MLTQLIDQEITLPDVLWTCKGCSQIGCCYWTEMDTKDTFVLLALLLLSVGLFGCLSVTYSVWSRQAEVASELNDAQNELHELQNELKNIKNRMQLDVPSQVKGQLKRNVRQADEAIDTLSAAKILTNALTKISEMRGTLGSFLNCNKNEPNPNGLSNYMNGISAHASGE